jgi:predicted ATP-grasp superfamily ATP-dependent carboligase
MYDLRQVSYAGALHDPLSAIVLSGISHVVDTSIINGEIVVRNGRLAALDERDLIKEANEISENMVRRAAERTGIEFLKTPAPEGPCPCIR